MIQTERGEVDRTGWCEKAYLQGKMREWGLLPGTGFPVRSTANGFGVSMTGPHTL